ncbi:hypothetical protein M413DRAFT_14221 [Hebeloma cylindrosporum]|uniref:PHD-type domain-containing protein n=1 Tax=Hebeloma cylindrosporum TaxID=76867 RepID=A0A0C3BVA7_HEBCY|nr:hypothetical protein M413DRAFT_14221 [Hebeloma cylindrosporum h7]
MTSFLNVDYCTGSLEIGGPHVQISATPRHELFFQVPASKYTDFQGSIFNACKERFSGTKVFESPETTDSCWRVKDGEILCPGTRKEIHKLILSIPVIWGIEIEAALEFGIIYDLVGFVLVDFQGTHFIARYATDDGTKIYTYDSMRHNGYPVHVEEMTFDAHMSGKNPQLPDGFMIWAATYVLRGGLAAQDKFYRIRTKEYATRYNLGFSEVTLDKLPTVSYHRAGFQEMDKKGRKWLFNPHANKTAEYISTPIPSRPPAQDGLESEDEMVAPIASQVSLPDSDFALNCRCGATGDGNLVYHQQDGEVVQCDECRDWSHIACQRHGRASNLLPKDQFLCDDCDPKAIQDLLPTKRTSTRRLMKACTLMNKRLEDRLRPGRAGLVRCSSFWYPVRVIQREGPKTWRVRWWRGCQFVDGGIEPGSLASISMDDIVDSLWLKRAERRKIRLGKWTHPHNLPTSEDILSDPESIRYTDEVHKALEPHKGPLRRLLTSPNSLHPEVSHEAIPAKKWLADNGKPLKKTLIPHVGTLSVIERAQIANWFEKTVSMSKKLRIQWMGLLPIAHAHTLFIAYRMAKDSTFESIPELEILRKAWEVQLTGSTAILREIDVDKECLESLEEEMFERTERTGISGNWQWGLDVGHHQDGWDPSFGVPENWDEKKRMGTRTSPFPSQFNERIYRPTQKENERNQIKSNAR